METPEITAANDQAISQPIINALMWDSLQFTRLISEAGISLETLMALEPAMRNELTQNSLHFTRLISEAHISLETLMALEPAMRNEITQNSFDVTQFISVKREYYMYLISNKIITEEQFVRSLFSQTPYLAIQNFVNENLSISATLPEGRQLNAENITDLTQLVKGVLEIRKNSRLLYQAANQDSTLFYRLPDVLNHKIAELTGNAHEDESHIAAMHYKKPGV